LETATSAASGSDLVEWWVAGDALLCSLDLHDCADLQLRLGMRAAAMAAREPMADEGGEDGGPPGGGEGAEWSASGRAEGERGQTGGGDEERERERATRAGETGAVGMRYP
jgi:hypothetical protein